MFDSSEREQAVVALLRQLWLGLSAYRLFPGSLDRPGFVAAAERIARTSELALASGTIDVEIGGGGFALEGSPLPNDGTIERLARACFERRAERLVIRGVPDHADLDAVFGVLATPVDELAAAGGPEPLLRGAGVRSLELSQVGPAAVAEADHVPAAMEGEGRASAELLPDAATMTADLMIEDLLGTPVDQATAILDRFRAAAAALPEDVARDLTFHRTLHEVVASLPSEIRRSLTEILVDRARDDPLAEQFIGTMSNAELTRALVDLGQSRQRDPVELARRLSAAGVRPDDLVDLTAALVAGQEEAGTVIAGLERIGIVLDEGPERTAGQESISDVMARYLIAMEQEDLGSMRRAFPEGDEHHRGLALAVLQDYFDLEEDPERLGAVLDVWVDGARRALRERDASRLRHLLAALDGVPTGRGPEFADPVDSCRRRALEPRLLWELVAADAETERSDTAPLLQLFGDDAVEALLDILAAEEDRRRRALLLGVLRRVAPGHHEPVAARLSDPRWYVVRNAVNILRSSGGTEVLGLLAEAARHREQAVRSEAMWGLVAAGGVDAIPFLLRLAADPDPHVRELAVEALGGLVAPEAVAAFAEVVRTSRDPAVRRHALDALGRHPAPTATEVLEVLASRRARPRLQRSLRRLARAHLRLRERGG